ncbi:MAG: cyclophilin [Deltaproteobacteria bacterium HGW-Deltaproteobacteria-4]|nr:MAG: cyclophilin [Deltaproteobacteria bacterium HGW-Deltaproteobacteria-4]
MKRVVLLILFLCVAATPAFAKEVVVIETGKGAITVELDEVNAPISVKNFLAYVDQGFYKETIFHRVIPGFMIQGGGLTAELQTRPPTNAPIKNEAGNGLKNLRGTIAMARTGIVDSATSQFFINLVDNKSLDHRDQSSSGFGYAVFGKVVGGMDVVDKIAATPTGLKNRFSDVPLETVVIKEVRRVKK